MRSVILVTGGAGFIASHIVDELLLRGERVRVLDNFSTGREENLAGALPEIELIRGDIRDLDAVRAAVEGAKVVIHHAALASVPLSIQDPILCNDVNVNGTLNLLVAARDAGVRRFVLASSSAVYGDRARPPLVETMPPAPISPYGLSKLAGEDYCRVFHQLYGLETVGLRYFNVFGPRQDPESPYAAVIPRFIAALLGGGRPVIYGDGEQCRDFAYVQNVVAANMAAVTAATAPGKVYNIGGGEQMSLNRLLLELIRLTDRSAWPEYLPVKKGDIRVSAADIRAAREELGYVPRVSVTEGLRETIAWYRETTRAAGEPLLPRLPAGVG
jgi:UDP-glucose 4-epimerase